MAILERRFFGVIHGWGACGLMFDYVEDNIYYRFYLFRDTWYIIRLASYRLVGDLVTTNVNFLCRRLDYFRLLLIAKRR